MNIIWTICVSEHRRKTRERSWLEHQRNWMYKSRLGAGGRECGSACLTRKDLYCRDSGYRFHLSHESRERSCRALSEVFASIKCQLWLKILTACSMLALFGLPKFEANSRFNLTLEWTGLWKIVATRSSKDIHVASTARAMSFVSLYSAVSIPQYHLPTLDSSSQDLNKNHCSPRILCRSADFESDGGRGFLALNMQPYATRVVACPVQVQWWLGLHRRRQKARRPHQILVIKHEQIIPRKEPICSDDGGFFRSDLTSRSPHRRAATCCIVRTCLFRHVSKWLHAWEGIVGEEKKLVQQVVHRFVTSLPYNGSTACKP
jgi:hypothetical protein